MYERLETSFQHVHTILYFSIQWHEFVLAVPVILSCFNLKKCRLIANDSLFRAVFIQQFE